MPPKAVKEKAVKGDEAEEVNRPYASTDVSANLKNKVTKANAQKVLQSLADKGSLTLKMYGKQSIFVYKQDLLESMPEAGIAELENDLKTVKSDLDVAKRTLKNLTTELNVRLAEPRTEDLQGEIERVEAQNAISLEHLVPLRKACEVESDGKPGEEGVGPIEQEKLDALDNEWVKWRKEWVARRKVYQALLDMVQPDLSLANRASFQEDIGVDDDPDELKALEASDLCKPKVAMRVLSKKAISSTAAGKPPADARPDLSANKSGGAGTKRKRE